MYCKNKLKTITRFSNTVEVSSEIILINNIYSVH